MCYSLFLCLRPATSFKKRMARLFSCEFYEISKNTFFTTPPSNCFCFQRIIFQFEPYLCHSKMGFWFSKILYYLWYYSYLIYCNIFSFLICKVYCKNYFAPSVSSNWCLSYSLSIWFLALFVSWLLFLLFWLYTKHEKFLMF